MNKNQIFLILTSIVLTAIVTSLVFLIPEWTNESIQPGTTLTTGTYSSNLCNENSDPCNGITVTTEIEISSVSDNQLSGEFFVRAYKNDVLLSEEQLSSEYNPFAGDGGNGIELSDNYEILSIDRETVKEKFSLTYNDNVPGWNKGGYTLELKTIPTSSDLDGRYIDFYLGNDQLEISFPQ